MPDGFSGAVLQLLIALIASGVMVKLLTLRQDRRKIAGEATTHEANAAATLTGASLQMLQAAQQQAQGAQADERDTRAENERLWAELNRTRWRVYSLQVREAVLEMALKRANIIIPPLEYQAESHTEFPPPDGLPDIGSDLD